jgi:hypothetical protein
VFEYGEHRRAARLLLLRESAVNRNARSTDASSLLAADDLQLRAIPFDVSAG